MANTCRTLSSRATHISCHSSAKLGRNRNEREAIKAAAARETRAAKKHQRQETNSRLVTDGRFVSVAGERRNRRVGGEGRRRKSGQCWLWLCSRGAVPRPQHPGAEKGSGRK